MPPQCHATKCLTIGAVMLLGLVVPGCGRGLRLVPVTGEVTLDGEPIANASVLFVPAERGPAAFGVTDMHGRFELYTVNRRGAPLGIYRVVVTLEHAVVGTGMRGADDIAPLAGSLPDVRSVVPERYSSPDTSDLIADVTPGRPHFDFALHSHGDPLTP